MMKILVIMYFGLYVVAARRDGKQKSSLSMRILNGEAADKSSHSWVAALLEPTIYDPRLICGGSIITPRHVLTAARCLVGRNASQVLIAVGEHKLSKIDITKLIQSILLSVHQLYDNANGVTVNDIGLVTTNKEIQYTSSVSPICFPTRRLYLDNHNAMITVVGWGKTSPTSITNSDDLLEVDLTVYPFVSCYDWFHLSAYNLRFLNNLCTYAEGKNVLSGDFGSPSILKYTINGKHVQVGIVSFASNPGLSVQTDVTSFVDWIQVNVNGNMPEQRICTVEM
ncbi:unnamed protein product [Nezara viridula]|uniref:Peptidase S1 domain-containing protein n=1 Tax=Nezara viridula TaxID=85310 RepID=A0A9P0HQG7_NEZVI|nr:unnamed protein product [Nezara viridula]